MENQLIPTETEQVALVKGLTFYRRLREHGTRTEQFLLQLPKDLLDPVAWETESQSLSFITLIYVETLSVKSASTLTPICCIKKFWLSLASFKSKSAPELLIINDPELTDGQIAELYRNCDAVVLPSRAEGFGIPMAEAMLMQKPLITTNYGGQLDFCNQENCFLLNYKLLPSKSHLGIPGAYLAEPDLSELKKIMRYIFLNSNSKDVIKKVDKAFIDVKKLTWEKTANKAVEFIDFIDQVKSLKNKRLGVISPFNTQGGIAEYSKELFSGIENSFAKTYYLANKDIFEPIARDDLNVLRCWNSNSNDFSELCNQIVKNKINIVHLQHHLNITNIVDLKILLKKLLALKIELYVTLHVVDVKSANWQTVKEELNSISKVFVHSKKDQVALKNANVNSEIFNFGILEFSQANKEFLRKALDIKSKHVIATHGLIHDKKGFLELIKAVSLLKKDFPDILLLAVTANNPANLSSTSTLKKMLELIDKLKLNNNLLLIDSYLANQQIVTLLQIADFIILPYHDLSEGASGAVRKAIASGRPVITTESEIFKDLKIGYKIKDNHPKTIANTVFDLYKNSSKLNSLEKDTQEYIQLNLWDKISQNYLTMLAN